MGFFRVRRSIRLAPGLKINLGKKGASLSVGKPGATVNIGPRGTRATVGLPGTGLSYTTGRLGASRGGRAEKVEAGPAPVPQSAVRRFFINVAACALFVLFLMMFSDDPANHHPWGMAAVAMLFGVLDQSSPPLIPDTTGRLARAITGVSFLLIGGVWQAVISTQMEGEHLFMAFFAALFVWGGVVQLVRSLCSLWGRSDPSKIVDVESSDSL